MLVASGAPADYRRNISELGRGQKKLNQNKTHSFKELWIKRGKEFLLCAGPLTGSVHRGPWREGAGGCLMGPRLCLPRNSEGPGEW